MDENVVRSLLMVAAHDEHAPPCEVSIRLARSRGRRRLRLQRIYLPGAAPVAAAAAVVLVLALSTVLTGGPAGRAGFGPPRPQAGAPTAAPSDFNPLVPYASLGWLPPGFSAQASAGVTDQVTSHAVTLQAIAPPADGRMVAVTVDTAGSCRIEPTTSTALAGRAAALRRQKVSTSGSALPANTLWCADPSPDGSSRFAELASAAPDIQGEQAYWTPDGALDWQYAPDAWAEVKPMDNPAHCAAATACTGGQVAGWVNVPAAIVVRGRVPTAHDVQRQPQSAASKALLLQIAGGLRYGDSTPLVFGFTLAGLPAGWQPADSYSYAPQNGRLAATGWSAGPAVDPTALTISVTPAVAANSEYACNDIAGQSTSTTLDGAPALLRTLNEPDKHWQSLCANDIDGVQPYLTLDLNTPGSNAPLPGSGEFGSLLAVFGSVRLLGPDPAAWTTDPVP
jgi:hypothetical protein